MKLPDVVAETQLWCFLVLQCWHQLTGIQEWRWCASVPVETSSDESKSVLDYKDALIFVASLKNIVGSIYTDMVLPFLLSRKLVHI